MKLTLLVFPSEITAGKGHLDDRNRNVLGPLPPDQVPQERAGNYEDMAGAILYLCSRAGWYLDGIEVIADGGRLKVVPSIL
jgi:NAD(P)-dependent dehydrogenase (short-subunit alcohol dehydrogenase family)